MACPCCMPYNRCVPFANCGTTASGFFDNNVLYTCERTSTYPSSGATGKCLETTLSASSPYTCVNNTFQGGAWISISGWRIWTDQEEQFFDAEHIAKIRAAEAQINKTFGVPVDCLGYCYFVNDTSEYIVRINFYLCERRVEVSLRSSALFAMRFDYSKYASAFVLFHNAGQLPKVDVSCSFRRGPGFGELPLYPCNCSGWSGSFGNGSYTVTSG